MQVYSEFDFILNSSNLLKSLTDCKDTVVVVPASCGKSSILCDTEKIPSCLDGDYHSCDTSKSI